jgi:uncharacterized protein YqiB (DUF1249 family)
MVTNTAQRQRYHINLQALHAECETNYVRLLKILPDFSTEDSRHIALQADSGQERRFQFFIFERARYTTTLEIAEFGMNPQWGLSASFSVRLYHDARMAEVLAFQRERNIEPFNAYPNPRMFQPDEKSQWNFLLGEWLMHCLTHGYNTGKVFVPCTAGGCV